MWRKSLKCCGSDSRKPQFYVGGPSFSGNSEFQSECERIDVRNKGFVPSIAQRKEQDVSISFA